MSTYAKKVTLGEIPSIVQAINPVALSGKHSLLAKALQLMCTTYQAESAKNDSVVTLEKARDDLLALDLEKQFQASVLGNPANVLDFLAILVAEKARIASDLDVIARQIASAALEPARLARDAFDAGMRFGEVRTATGKSDSSATPGIKADSVTQFRVRKYDFVLTYRTSENWQCYVCEEGVYVLAFSSAILHDKVSSDKHEYLLATSPTRIRKFAYSFVCGYLGYMGLDAVVACAENRVTAINAGNPTESNWMPQEQTASAFVASLHTSDPVKPEAEVAPMAETVPAVPAKKAAKIAK